MTDRRWERNSTAEEVVRHAGKNEWGYSCCAMPEMTTTMRRGTVFFTNNKCPEATNANIRQISSLIKPFADPENLKLLWSLFCLTAHSEEAYAAPAELGEKSGFTEEKVRTCLEGELSPFVSEKEEKEDVFRLKGMYLNLIPILMLLNFE